MCSISSRSRLMASPGDEPSGKALAPGRCRMRCSRLCRIKVFVTRMTANSPSGYVSAVMDRATTMPISTAARPQMVERASWPRGAPLVSTPNIWRTNRPGSNGHK